MFKKVVALLCAAVMVVGTAFPVFAAEDITTLENGDGSRTTITQKADLESLRGVFPNEIIDALEAKPFVLKNLLAVLGELVTDNSLDTTKEYGTATDPIDVYEKDANGQKTYPEEPFNAKLNTSALKQAKFVFLVIKPNGDYGIFEYDVTAFTENDDPTILFPFGGIALPLVETTSAN